MREQLIQYVELLFAGAADCEDIKQEILQNTLDRYDDLIAQGKVPEAAYRLAISGIGDINTILGQSSFQTPASAPAPQETDGISRKKVLQAVGVALYILCLIPLIVLSDLGMDTLGLCGTLILVAAATFLMILGARKDEEETKERNTAASPRKKTLGSIRGLVWAIGLVIYFLTSFLLGAWHITWLIFPIVFAINNLIEAIWDLKEEA